MSAKPDSHFHVAGTRARARTDGGMPDRRRQRDREQQRNAMEAGARRRMPVDMPAQVPVRGSGPGQSRMHPRRGRQRCRRGRAGDLESSGLDVALLAATWPDPSIAPATTPCGTVTSSVYQGVWPSRRQVTRPASFSTARGCDGVGRSVAKSVEYGDVLCSCLRIGTRADREHLLRARSKVFQDFTSAAEAMARRFTPNQLRQHEQVWGRHVEPGDARCWANGLGLPSTDSAHPATRDVMPYRARGGRIRAPAHRLDRSVRGARCLAATAMVRALRVDCSDGPPRRRRPTAPASRPRSSRRCPMP